MEKEIFWSAPEFPHYEKNASWYWIVIIISLALVGIALFSQNFLFAIFIAIAALLIITWGSREPRMIDFTLSERGIDIGKRKFYPFDHLGGFAIIPSHEGEEFDELVLRAKGRFTTWIKITIAAARRDAIKNLLSKFLPEVEYEESLAEHIGRLLRF